MQNQTVKRRSVLIVLVCFLSTLSFMLKGEEADKILFGKYLQKMQNPAVKDRGEVMAQTALFFLETPYVAKTLEREPEQLVVNLQELDCMTFVESVLALSETVLSPSPSWDTFLAKLQSVRYRNGEIVDYTSRLHYTSDWIFDNERRGNIQDVTQSIGGKPLSIAVSFMSTHPDSYKQLANHPEWITVMAEKEKEINGRSYFYIPQEEIPHCADKIQTGDIVCFVTAIKGLDISHVGIIYNTEGKQTFIHASTTKKKVIVNEAPLSTYVSNIKNTIGIMIIRPRF